MGLHLGGFVGYSAHRMLVEVLILERSWREVVGGIPSGKMTSSLNRPVSQMVFSLPGIEHSHFFKSRVP